MGVDLNMTFSINGKLEGGLKCAHISFALQLPHVIREFPELAGCYAGTLNLRLEMPLLVLVPDHRTKAFAWHPPFPGVTEAFDFLRVRLEAPIGAKPVSAWFYIAHGSQHRADPALQEVVTKQQMPVTDGVLCRVHIDRETIRLPYAALSPIVFVV
jgi:hypothetical protein